MNELSPVPLCIEGLPLQLHMYVHGEQDRFVSQRIRQEGIWEPYETALVMALLGEGDVFVDVGANLGYFSILAASQVGESGAVFAFEPDPENFRLLKANAELNGFSSRIECCHAGLAAQRAEGQLYLSADNLGDHKIHGVDSGRSSVAIELLHGSDYLRDRTPRVDLVKIDTQGSEFEVVTGLMPLLLSLSAPPHILIELTPLSLREAGASGRQLVELLGELGQPLWIVDHIEHQLVAHSSEELAQWCDDVDKVPADEGFMNILVGPAPGIE